MDENCGALDASGDAGLEVCIDEALLSICREAAFTHLNTPRIACPWLQWYASKFANYRIFLRPPAESVEELSKFAQVVASQILWSRVCHG